MLYLDDEMRSCLVAIAVLLAGASSAAAQLSNEECLACHDTVNGKKFAASIHGPLQCTNCHSDITAPGPHEPAPKAVDCSQCHADAASEYGKSVHARGVANRDHAAPTCTSCHGKHDILPKSDPASRTNRFNIPGTCASCHANVQVTRNHPVPPAEVINKYFESVHGKGTLQQGLSVSAVCSDCHGSHLILPKSDPQSSISHANVPRTCKKCHEGIYRQFEQSTHGQQWKRGNANGPVCVTCHTAHGISSTESAAFRQGIATGCMHCHEKEAPTYRDSFHGQATALGYLPAAKCSDCHTPHFNLPRSDPRSSVAPANLAHTCGKCHRDVTAKFLQYDPHSDPSSRKVAPVYYVAQFMKWLLLAVFGFFGIHTILWLQRSVVAVARHEIPKQENDGPWVLRFRTSDRLTHVAIVVSFLILAATGLPLLYSHMAWGQTLARAMGGVGLSRALHRLFAIVTFGYAIYHLGHILKGAFVKRDWAMFWGPQSMVPRWRDIIDMKNMFRWFFYLGPRPRLDRWTYWEKFDYFAVFWGVPIIGLSGLMLWMPQLTTRILPGWMLNIAAIVHGEEALLAIGFIFTFHFFHTHLRPENFPMDVVMFTGRLPLERFRHERPDEYERLKREGKLDQIVTVAPTPRQLRFARWFGFTTLAVGVILIVAIYFSFVSRFFMGR
jgi:cytochrome b subunit of formate dehydrogenase